MKAKTFENLIRKVVREEIDYALRREIKSLKEDLRDELKPIVTEELEKTNEISLKEKSSLKEKIMGKKPFKKLNFADNSTLNDLLNETAAGDTNTESAMAPVSDPFSSGAPMETTGIPTEVAKAVTRDYSGLMKTIIIKKVKYIIDEDNKLLNFDEYSKNKKKVVKGERYTDKDGKIKYRLKKIK